MRKLISKYDNLVYISVSFEVLVSIHTTKGGDNRIVTLLYVHMVRLE